MFLNLFKVINYCFTMEEFTFKNTSVENSMLLYKVKPYFTTSCYYSEYFFILIFTVISFVIVLVLLVISYSVSSKNITDEKASAYECGFEPFDESRKTFDIQFYIVGVLFLIFDLEIAFLFPWALSLSYIGLFGFWVMCIFILFLTIGFVYEWQRGALDWSFNFKE